MGHELFISCSLLKTKVPRAVQSTDIHLINTSVAGFETARSLALHGCTVIFACRNIEAAEMAVAKVRSERPSVNCHVMHLDLQSLQSVKNFVTAFQKNYR